ncbi:MAG: DNA-binding NtrC family response regulator [Alteromonadaceae bacterium]
MKSILLIDNNLAFVNVLVPKLKEWGYTVSSCDNAVNAMQLVKDKTYKLVLCELYLPSLRADRLFTLLYRNNPELNCCLLTSADYDDPLIKKTIKLKNVKGLLKKPLSFEKLDAFLKKTFDVSQTS